MAGIFHRDISEIFTKGEKGNAVERFIRAGVDVNKKMWGGDIPLQWAAREGQKELVKLLLEHGANIEVRDKYSRSAIHYAAYNGNNEIVKLLLDHGENIDVKVDSAIQFETPIYFAALQGHIDTVEFLLSAGADPYISGGGVVLALCRDIIKRDWSEQTEEKILSSYSSEENNNYYIAAALAENKDDFLMKFIKKVSEKRGKLVDSFLSKDAVDISNLLTFIRRHVTKNENTTDQNIKMLIGGEGKNRFYLVKTKALGDKSGPKSLLQYIVDNGPRMMKQREELLDVLVTHIENVDSENKPLVKKEIELKIINNLKLVLPSSTGLAECIAMTEEKFPWSKMKSRGMKAVAFISYVLSLALYSVDALTDAQFVQDMLDNSQTDLSSIERDKLEKTWYLELYDYNYEMCSVLSEYEKGQSTIFKLNVSRCIDFYEEKARIGQQFREIGPRFEDMHKFTECFWFSLVHLIAPIAWTFFVTLYNVKTMKVLKISKIPFPFIARFVKLEQDSIKYELRETDDFEKKVSEMEAEIADYEDTVNLSSGIEAATEACPQFFFQTVYFLPNLVINLVSYGYEGWKELVSFKMLSIALSFTSVAVSNYFIR